ncbi:hypothetical protein Tco_0530243 [Tanacetum coccineum]
MDSPLFPRVASYCTRVYLLVCSQQQYVVCLPDWLPQLLSIKCASIGSSPFWLLEQLRLGCLVGKIQVVAVDRLWEHIPIMGLMVVLQPLKTDMMKHDVEVESLGKCVDEIDKPTELIGEMQLKQEDRSYVHASNKLHLHVVHVVPGTKSQLKHHESVGVERGLRMDRTDEEFRGLSQRVAGFIPDAKEKFDRVIVAFPDTTFPFLDKVSQNSQSSLQDIARLEPDRVTSSHQTSFATASLRANTHTNVYTYMGLAYWASMVQFCRNSFQAVARVLGLKGEVFVPLPSAAESISRGCSAKPPMALVPPWGTS